MARVVSLDVYDNGFFVTMDDPVELVTDDAVTDDAAIVEPNWQRVNELKFK